MEAFRQKIEDAGEYRLNQMDFRCQGMPCQYRDGASQVAYSMKGRERTYLCDIKAIERILAIEKEL